MAPRGGKVADSDRQFCEVAVQNKLLNKKQQKAVLSALEKAKKGKKAPNAAKICSEKGYLSKKQIKAVTMALEFRKLRWESKLYARIAAKSKFVKRKHIEEGLVQLRGIVLPVTPERGSSLLNELP